jgi:hypothetical protein
VIDALLVSPFSTPLPLMVIASWPWERPLKVIRTPATLLVASAAAATGFCPPRLRSPGTTSSATTTTIAPTIRRSLSQAGLALYSRFHSGPASSVGAGELASPTHLRATFAASVSWGCPGVDPSCSYTSHGSTRRRPWLSPGRALDAWTLP